MSRAFRSEDIDDSALVRARAPLPDGVPNYVTPRGLQLLRDELARLRVARAAAVAREENALVLAARIAELDERLASAELVDPRAQPKDVVRFGATVVVRNDRGDDLRYRIVGVDEADAARGDVVFFAPLARALLGLSVGDVAEVRSPRGTEELEVVAIEHDD